jgi:hypothetical protein
VRSDKSNQKRKRKRESTNQAENFIFQTRLHKKKNRQKDLKQLMQVKRKKKIIAQKTSGARNTTKCKC